jgi:histidinol-phosphate aminotransferase
MLPGLHGGPDALGVPRLDFSTCVNVAAPDETLRQRIAAADATRYPDPGYRSLRERLAAWHRVAPRRVLIAASASEFIQRVTAVGSWLASGPVAVPDRAYGDYARAARAHGRAVTHVADDAAALRWVCEPSSPFGTDQPPHHLDGERATVLDAVYEPLRLEGDGTWPPALRERVFVLHGPNKALGLAGIRGAYAIAPGAPRWTPWIDALEARTPSWPLGAHAVAMLDAWIEPRTQEQLRLQKDRLRSWKRCFIDALGDAGFTCRPSATPHFGLRMRSGADFDVLRERGIKLRDTTSFGMPGWARVNTLPPPAQSELVGALKDLSR